MAYREYVPGEILRDEPRDRMRSGQFAGRVVLGAEAGADALAGSVADTMTGLMADLAGTPAPRLVGGTAVRSQILTDFAHSIDIGALGQVDPSVWAGDTLSPATTQHAAALAATV